MAQILHKVIGLLFLVAVTNAYTPVRRVCVGLRCRINGISLSGCRTPRSSFAVGNHAAIINEHNKEKISLQSKLSSLGQAGILAYGSLNCLYYTLATAIVWTLTGSKAASSPVSIVSSSQRLSVAVGRVGKVIAGVWLGSQATKILRLAGAVAIAPLLDKAIDYVHQKFSLPSRGRAFGVIALGLWSIFFVFYGLLVISAFLTTR